MSNAKIKITEPGWETFTGNFGGVEFADGVSEREVTEFESNRISASVRVVDLATGEQMNEAAVLAKNIGAVVEPRTEAQTITQAQFDKLNSNEPAAPKAEPAKIYTPEELLKLADEKGITGLREVGGPLGAKGRAIPELIDAIVKAQADAVAAVAPKVAA